MSRIRKSIIIISAMTIIIFLLFFAQMLFTGVGIGNSLLFASVMGALMLVVGAMTYGYREFLQRRAFSGKKLDSDTLDAEQKRTVEIDLPFDAAFNLTLDALKTLDDKNIPLPDDILVKMESILPRKQILKIHEIDREMGNIRAGIRGKTMGLADFWDFSRIDIQLQRIDSQTTRIRIESKNNIPGEVYDLGKNLHYVNELALYLRRESQHMSAEAHLQENNSKDTETTDSIGDAHQDSKTNRN